MQPEWRDDYAHPMQVDLRARQEMYIEYQQQIDRHEGMLRHVSSSIYAIQLSLAQLQVRILAVRNALSRAVRPMWTGLRRRLRGLMIRMSVFISAKTEKLGILRDIQSRFLDGIREDRQEQSVLNAASDALYGPDWRQTRLTRRRLRDGSLVWR